MEETPKLPNSAKELRQRYGVCQTTWWTWLEPLRGKAVREYAKVYRPSELKAIVALLGEP